MHSLERDPVIQSKVTDLLIPSEKVAHVQIGNPLEHALLVLIKSGYSAVPVLGPEFKLQGLISKTLILDSVLGMESIEVDKLSTLKVEDVMNRNIPRIKEEEEFIKALGLTINHPFLCVEDTGGIFKGILTRRAIIKLFTRHLKAHT